MTSSIGSANYIKCFFFLLFLVLPVIVHTSDSQQIRDGIVRFIETDGAERYARRRTLQRNVGKHRLHRCILQELYV